MYKKPLASLAVLAAVVSTAPAALYIDFDNNGLDPLGGQEAGGPRTQTGFQSYSATHEVSNTFTTQNFPATLHGTATVVSILPNWPNTTDARVRQMIDRGPGNDVNWNNANGDLDLLTDWLGTDSRTGGGGTGDFDGTTGTPTYLTLTLGGLVAGNYRMISFHHDTENMNTFFDIDVSVDGGTSFTNVVSGARMTASTGLGTPAVTPTTGPDALSLSSTQTYSFSANGADEVVVRYTPLSNSVVANGGGVHQTFFGINGFALIPEPSSTLMLLGGLVGLLYRRRG